MMTIGNKNHFLHGKGLWPRPNANRPLIWIANMKEKELILSVIIKCLNSYFWLPQSDPDCSAHCKTSPHSFVIKRLCIIWSAWGLSITFCATREPFFFFFFFGARATSPLMRLYVKERPSRWGHVCVDTTFAHTMFPVAWRQSFSSVRHSQEFGDEATEGGAWAPTLKPTQVTAVGVECDRGVESFFNF